jgi:hypothetical protein
MWHHLRWPRLEHCPASVAAPASRDVIRCIESLRFFGGGGYWLFK